MDSPTFPLPEWVEPDKYQLFALQIAALYHNGGSINTLSEGLGMSKTALHMALRRPAGINERTCLALEALLGSERFPRHFFRPDLFAVGG